MNKTPSRKLRCAVYTRKSSEEGLDMAFNSLDAQREACEAYIASQKPEGWEAVDDRYDDGGISGATLERPALERLLADIEAGRVDILAVYKIDRLSRSLMDFAKLVGVFEAHGVTFASITQQFNTTTPMGRLTINILLSFAQFEREVTAERIRDKIAASRRKGMWMGGHPPRGYDVKDRKLVVNAEEVALVRMIFERFPAIGSATQLARTLRAEGGVTKRGRPIDKGTPLPAPQQPGLYRRGRPQGHRLSRRARGHRAARALGQGPRHPEGENPRTRANITRAQTPALLKGLVFGADGRAMTPTHTRKRGRLYRYYAAAGLAKGEIPAGVVRRVPTAEIEAAVVHELRALLRAPEIVVATWRAARERDSALSEAEVGDALRGLDPLWDELFPAEQTRAWFSFSSGASRSTRRG